MKNQPAKKQPQRASGARSPMGLCVLMAAVLFAITIATANNLYMPSKVTAVICGVILVPLLFFSDKQRMGRLARPLPLAVFAYVLLAGISTLYARSGKFAIAEFSVNMAAFCVFVAIVLYVRDAEIGFRTVARVLAGLTAPVALLSIDAASSNVLMPVFRAVTTALGIDYADLGVTWYSRINTIFGNPNTYAGLLSVACLLALYLVMTAQGRRQKLLSGVLLMVNLVGYLLAFSMGSLGFFAAACVLFLVLCPSAQRMGLFLLLLQSAVVTLVAGGLAATGFQENIGQPSGSFVPLLAVVLGCVLFCLLECFVRDAVAAKLAGKGKAMLLAGGVVVVAIAVYIIAGLQIAGPIALEAGERVTRTAALAPGQYSLAVEGDAVNVRVAYKDRKNLVMNNDTELVSADSTQPVTFTVPEGSELVFFTLTAPEGGAAVSAARYDGTETGALKLKYKLLPSFVADRVQDLAANGNVVQRSVYRQDAIKLFKTSPVIGRGLGGFQNGAYSVQDYHYETKYAHNHYVELLCDLGVLGLLAFLAVLVFAARALWRRRARMPLGAALLAACLLQMFGQAVTDLTWSVGVCLTMFYAVLGMIAAFYHDGTEPRKSLASTQRFAVPAFLLIFVVLIGLNLVAKAYFDKEQSFQSAETSAQIDLFERNDYMLSYVMSSAGTDDPHVQEMSAKYAEKLRKVESNTIAPELANYYWRVGDTQSAFAVIEAGVNYTKASAEGWNSMFSLYAKMLNPANGGTASDEDVQRMYASYQNFCERNRTQLDDLELTRDNNLFLTQLRAIVEQPGADRNTILTTLFADSRYAPDTNNDGAPDTITLDAGEGTWQGGAFTAETDCVLRLAMPFETVVSGTLKIDAPEGSYTAEKIDEVEGEGAGAILGDIVLPTKRTIAITVSAGTTLTSIIYSAN